MWLCDYWIQDLGIKYTLAKLFPLQIGKTKVFLRAGQMTELVACRAEVLGRSASFIQRKVRTFLCRKNFILLQFSATEIQRVARGQLAQHRYECMRREAASLKIQKNFRMYISRNAYKTICATAVCIQTGMRGMAARNDLRFRKRTQASIVIQGHYRGYSARTYYKKLKKAAIATQCSWRRTLARRELRMLRMVSPLSSYILFQMVQTLANCCVFHFRTCFARDGASAPRNKAVKTQENEKLQHVLQELELQLQETKEAKTQENEKLQQALQEMELQFQDTKAALIQEQEAAKKVAEENSTIQENSVNVVDNELINKLTGENEKLKELVNSLEKKTGQVFTANDTDNELINKLSSENQHLKEIPVNVTANELINKLTSENEHLKERINSLEKKTTLEIPVNFTENEVINKLTAENEQLKLSSRLEEKLSDMETDNQVLRQQTLLSSSSRRMSEKSSPATTLAAQGSVPAKTFGVEDKRRSIMERHRDPDNNDCMAYWLYNTSSLFFHLQRCIRVPTARKPPTPTTFFGRMTQGFRSSNSLSSSSFDVVHQVDAKYPALLFKQQLAAYMEKKYGIVREYFKKELSPLLSSCIQADRSSNDNSQPTGSWVSTIECLNKYLKILKDDYVPPVLVQKLFNQIFQYINVEIFNSLLLHSECCTFKIGEYIKSGLAELEVWCNEATEECIGSSLDELKHANQAVRFLVAPEKDGLSYDDLTNDLCPVLSAQQLHRICTLYCDDDDQTQKKSPDVTTRLKLLMTDDAEEDGKSFLMGRIRGDEPLEEGIRDEEFATLGYHCDTGA
ncbi:hypothetical protein Fmac_008027 [Flemingia macrophylla]|uniref:Dilute domain-containing protein n=1 Tax=Flemingia macrophylla TaxID=520843 RepID=A0ABD1MW93_9FABA